MVGAARGGAFRKRKPASAAAGTAAAIAAGGLSNGAYSANECFFFLTWHCYSLADCPIIVSLHTIFNTVAEKPVKKGTSGGN
jgi:hypothetical protein